MVLDYTKKNVLVMKYLDNRGASVTHQFIFQFSQPYASALFVKL